MLDFFKCHSFRGSDTYLFRLLTSVVLCNGGGSEEAALTLFEAQVRYPLNGSFPLFHVLIQRHQEGLLICAALLTHLHLQVILGRHSFTTASTAAVPGLGQS